MPSLSTPIGELRSEYGVIVVGSGYGGAIAAYRMAQEALKRAKQRAKATGKSNDFVPPDYSVCVLERGLERQPGDFPSSVIEAAKDIQTDGESGRMGSRTALFDFRFNRDVSALVGCGLGGTSLINAAVMLEPSPAVMADPKWPVSLRGTGRIEKHFDTVRRSLGVSTMPQDIRLEKVQWLADAAAPLNTQVKATPLAISFRTAVNRFNVQQQRCLMCGSCITGCNHSAKNTVASNYLPGAAHAGAAIFTGVETRAIQRAPGGWWIVHVRLNDKVLNGFGNPDIAIRTRMVFLGAGTLGSTEILLRSRAEYGLKLSDQVGRGFSGNGDVIAFGYNAPTRVNGFGYGSHIPRDAAVGPTITAMIDERTMKNASGAMIQEGAIPGALRIPLRFAAPIMARATNLLADTTIDLGFRSIWREVDTIIRGVRHGALARTQTFLAMAEDDGDGSMHLKSDRLRIRWENARYQTVYDRITSRLQEITAQMKGRYVINPFWTRFFGKRLMTVHPLGGCCIGDDAKSAVVNAQGQVFDGSDPGGTGVHDGLYVCDGAIIPRSLGTNPSLTISALAEHIAEGARLSPQLRLAPGGLFRPGRIVRSVPGLHYGERTRGSMTLNGRATSIELILYLSAESIDELLNQSAHRVRVMGIARTPDLEPFRRTWTISEGTLNVLVDDPRQVDTKLLVYRLTLTAADGSKIWLRGHKTVNLDTLKRHPWRTVTRVPFLVFSSRPVDPPGGRVNDTICDLVEIWDRNPASPSFVTGAHAAGIVGAGSVQSSVLDAIRLALSMRFVREPNPVRRLRSRWRFNWLFFNRTILTLRVWILRSTRKINPFEAQSAVHVSRPASDFAIPDIKAEPPRFTLTSYRGREVDLDRPPVLLAPGFGMSSDAFRVGRMSMAEYLHREGYDVWLLDYRGSDKLDISLTQFTLDDLAGDFAEAIHCLHKGYAKQRRIRVVAHCVASLAMQMALLKGGLREKGLHSVVLSQSFAFIDPPFFSRLKARAHLPQLLSYLDFRPVLTSDYDKRTRLRTRVIDRLLYFYPSRERCHEGVCRRLLLLYGEVLKHDQLDRETHDAVYDLFDRANLKTFKHLQKMFIQGHLVDQYGGDTYLTPAAGLGVNVPITFLQGSDNGLFRVPGARRTHKWFVEHGPFGADNLKMFDLKIIPGYGHLDNFIGRNAPRDVFPVVSGALSRMEALALRSARERRPIPSV